MMSYLPHFLKKRQINKCVICVVGNACKSVVELFGEYEIEVYSQNELDELIQASLYSKDSYAFIAHQDRPYVVNLHRALYIKRIPLDKIYCCGVFGLPWDTKPFLPYRLKDYADLNKIEKGKSVIFSPYAKSVVEFPANFWKPIVDDFVQRGYKCFTNVSGDEKPLEGTMSISPQINELQSAIEWAGNFVGIRNGLCDIISNADANKIILYPDYNYCDTKWKSIDIYAIEGCINITVTEGFKWKKI